MALYKVSEKNLYLNALKDWQASHDADKPRDFDRRPGAPQSLWICAKMQRVRSSLLHLDEEFF